MNEHLQKMLSVLGKRVQTKEGDLSMVDHYNKEYAYFYISNCTFPFSYDEIEAMIVGEDKK